MAATSKRPGCTPSCRRGSDGKYSLIFDGSNERWTFSPAGWLLAQAERNGNANTPRCNADGPTASITDSPGRVTSFAYINGLVSAVTDPTGTTAAVYTGARSRATSAAKSNISTGSRWWR
ncbi:hypothetical protein AB0F91_46105 [Amycolatopsis sp. NPDC023774]|uniref:hypothetical protein n=1 Tax=Amycolatopsis sp. NPDC023774 TaxID=3155015 RepID=UPI0033D8E729